MGRVVVIGSLNRDLVVRVDRHPLPGETVLANNATKYWGGKGANQAIAAADAGAKVSLVGRVGDDEDGEAYRARLQARAIDVDSLRTTVGMATGQALIAVSSNAENSIIVSPGANERLSMHDLGCLESLSADDVVLLSLEIGLPVVEKSVRQAARSGARVILNLAPFAQLRSDVLDLADPVVVNQHEAQLLSDAGYQPSSLLTTAGAGGSIWGTQFVAAVAASRLEDTTGAGDTYCGVLAAHLASGDNQTTAMRAATAAASRSVGWRGAQPR